MITCVEGMTQHRFDVEMRSDLRALLGAWQTLLPREVEIAGGPINGAAPSLTIEEYKSAGQVASDRMLELRAGRQYAKEALSLLGFKNVELPILPDRSVAWPTGTTGSITHVRGRHVSHCAAVVGVTTQFSSIGIDIEYQHSVPEEAWETFLTVREISQLQELDLGARQSEVLHRWCVKESAIKAAGMRLDPLEIDTEKVNSDGQWRIFSTAIAKFGQTRGFPWLARSTQAEGFVLAAIAMHRN